MAIVTRQIGNLTEISTNRGGYYITQSFPTNFHTFFTAKILLRNERVEDFKEVSEAEKATLEVLDAKWEKPYEMFIKQWNEACIVSHTEDSGLPDDVRGRYNGQTGFFELHGLKDISLDEAIAIFEAGRLMTSNAERFYATKRIRTHLPPRDAEWYQIVLKQTFWSCDGIETIYLPKCIAGYLSIRSYSLQNCTIESVSTSDAFSVCYKLTNLTLLGQTEALCTKVNVDLRHSPLLTADSIRSLIMGSSATKNLIHKVHPTVFAKITDASNADYYPLLALATSKNIQFATS